MKSKKVLVAGLFLATTCGIAYCVTTVTQNAESTINLTDGKTDNHSYHNSSYINWLKQYPQLANIESNNQTAVIDKLRTSESISQLIGPISNSYGVRDDILYAIISVVPESQPKLLRAAIQEAYYRTLGFYSISNEDKIKYTRMASLLIGCAYDIGKSTSSADGHNVGDDILAIVRDKNRDTRERSAYVSNLEQTVFAWQTLGYGEGEDHRCKRGDY